MKRFENPNRCEKSGKQKKIYKLMPYGLGLGHVPFFGWNMKFMINGISLIFFRNEFAEQLSQL